MHLHKRNNIAMKDAVTKMYNRSLRVGLLVFIFLQLNLPQTIVNGEEWAIHVENGETAANALAHRHNLLNLGEVLPESNIYHLALKHEHRGKRSVEDLSSIHDSLKEAPETKWLEHQTSLKRSRRIPSPL